MFRQLSIKNFKGIRRLEINELGKLNLFVGNNNSGKTRVLESLYLSPNLYHRREIFSSPRSNLENFKAKNSFENISKRNKGKRLLELLQHFEPRIREISLEIDGFYIDLENRGKVRMETLGEGIKKIFNYICYIEGQENPEHLIYLIDEIENSLHYSFLRKLWHYLFKVANEKKSQIFATTHSLDCLRSFVHATRETYINDIRIFRLIRKDDDIVDFATYDLESAMFAIEHYDLEIR